MAYAQISDLVDRWRPLNDDEVTPATTLLGAASRLLDSRIPDLTARITSGALDSLLVTDVVCEIVRRALTMRRTGVEQAAVTTGQITESLRYSNPEGNLYVTRDELARLSPSSSRRAFSITTLPAL